MPLAPEHESRRTLAVAILLRGLTLCVLIRPFRCQTCGSGINTAQATQAATEEVCVPGVPAMGQRLNFALIGDSLTQQSFDYGGWGARLASLYQRKADIRLRGYSGYNTRWALETLEYNFPKNGPKYDLATIWFGANDAALSDGHNERQHIPVNEYKENLGKLVDRMLHLDAKVIVFTPPPVDEGARQILVADESGVPEKQAVAERTMEASKQYAEAVKEVAKSRGVLCLDLWKGLQEHSDWRGLLSDGLHFNPKGNEAVFDLVIKFIDSNLPQFRAADIPPDFPWNTDIDASNYKASFAGHQSVQK